MNTEASVAIYWDFENVHAAAMSIEHGRDWFDRQRNNKLDIRDTKVLDIAAVMQYASHPRRGRHQPRLRQLDQLLALRRDTQRVLDGPRPALPHWHERQERSRHSPLARHRRRPYDAPTHRHCHPRERGFRLHLDRAARASSPQAHRGPRRRGHQQPLLADGL